MDTSDGVVASLDELMRQSHFGLQLELTSLRILHPEARNLARKSGIPTFAFLAGPHGEFELIFSIPRGRLSDFRAAADASRISILELGVARREPGLQLADQEGGAWPDTAEIRNLSPRQAEDLDQYLSHLVALADPSI
jgi:thiamine-monophosphate kinase